MKRIYHHYEKWECWKAGFYDNVTGKKRQQLAQKVIELFRSPKITTTYMNLVPELWPYSCEQNLTNLSMNRIAYIGQAACCIYAGVPCYVTMNAWNLVELNHRNFSDNYANITILKWEKRQKLKNTSIAGLNEVIQMGFQTKFL